MSSLDEAIETFHREGRADPGFPIDLSGYTAHWKVDLSGSGLYVLISQNLQGQILSFSDRGELAHRFKTTEITSFQVCDVDADGRSELITTQIDSRGTGIVEQRFHVYELVRPVLRQLWDGVAYSLLPREDTPGKIEYTESFGFLRCGGGGLQHYLEEDDGSGSRIRTWSNLHYTAGGSLQPRERSGEAEDHPH